MWHPFGSTPDSTLVHFLIDGYLGFLKNVSFYLAFFFLVLSNDEHLLVHLCVSAESAWVICLPSALLDDC